MSMMQKSPRPLSASLLAPKGAARPAAPLEDAATDHMITQPAAHHPADAENAAFSNTTPPGHSPGSHGEPRTLFDVPPAPKLTPKFGKKQTPLPDTPEADAPGRDTPTPPAQAFNAETTTNAEPQPAAPPQPQNTPTAQTQAPQRTAPNTVEHKAADTKKAAFTFRMCEARHFRLRLLSAHQNRSSQKILEDALDTYLATHAPQTAGLACHCFEGAGDS